MSSTPLRLTAPVYVSARALSQHEGPSSSPRWAIVDGNGLFRWHANDESEVDNDAVIGHSGGSVGRWIRSVAFAATDLVELVRDATVDNEPDTLALRDEDGASHLSFVVGDRDKYEVLHVVTSNVALPALPSSSLTGGVALTEDQSVGLVGQTDPKQNGIYIVQSGALVRRSDFDSSADVVPGASFWVATGGSRWRLSSPASGTISVGTDNLVFTQSLPARGVVELGSVSNEVTFNGLRGRIQHLTATGSVNLTFTNLQEGETYFLWFTQDATGYHSLTIDGATPIATGSTSPDQVPSTDTMFQVSALPSGQIAVERSSAEIEATRLHGRDANTLPSLLYLRGGRPSAANHGAEPTNNLVFEMGLGAQSTNGETSQINFMHGDARIAQLTPWIAAEIGFVDVFGYDPAASEAPGLWRQRTPRYLRIHTGDNADTGMRCGILMFSSEELLLTTNTYVQLQSQEREGRIDFAWSTLAPSATDAGNGGGGLIKTVNRRVQTVGASTRRLFLDNLVANTRFAYCEAIITAHSVGNMRNRYRVFFTWLGATGGSSALVSDVEKSASGTGAAVGDISVSDNGAGGDVYIDVTQAAGVYTTTWTLFLKIHHEAVA